MKIRKCIAPAFLAVYGSLTAAWGGEIKVVANSSVDVASISTEELKDVFLLMTTSLKGGHVEPVLAKGGPVHEAFIREFLGKNDMSLQIYYRSLAFTGKGSIPKEFGSDADVVAFVAKTKGAIGYVAAGAATSGVKVLPLK